MKISKRQLREFIRQELDHRPVIQEQQIDISDKAHVEAELGGAKDEILKAIEALGANISSRLDDMQSTLSAIKDTQESS